MERLIKKTGDKIFPLGLGCMRLPTKGNSIDKEKAKELLFTAIDNGVNFLDTGYNYHGGESESFLGETLTEEYRSKVKISTKLPVWTVRKREDMEEILDKQLLNLQINCIDYYFLHNLSLKSLKHLIKKGVFDFLEENKARGKIKNVGFSYHGSKDDLKEVIDIYDWDMCMVQYNYFDDNIQVSYEGIKYAHSKGLGIFVMEPLKGGILSGKMPEKVEKIFKNTDDTKSNVYWALSWVLNHSEIDCVLSGMGDLNQLNENITITKNLKPNSLSPNELKTIEDAKSVMEDMLEINCATCGYCMNCPNGVDIPQCFQIYNEKFLFNKKRGPISQSFMNYYMVLSGIMDKPAYAGLCDGCGKCLRKCPQHLDIPEELNKVSKEFEHGRTVLTWIIKNIGLPIMDWFNRRNHKF